MDNNIDVNEQLKIKNQEMLLNKKKIDIDTSIESFLEFFSNYSTINIASEINNKVCSYQNINPNSEQGKILYNTITSFFFIMVRKLKVIFKETIDPIKEKLIVLDDNEYNKELSHIYAIIINKMLDYCVDSIDMLNNELTTDASLEIKNRIRKYLSEMITIRMMNVFREKLTFYIRLINNNNKENQEVIEGINERTIKGV